MAEAVTQPSLKPFLRGLERRKAAFPVLSNKQPVNPYWELGPGGYHTAKADELERHIGRGGRIGIIPGQLGFLVVDIDKPKEPEEGKPPLPHADLADSMPFVREQLGDPVVAYTTASGGEHCWYLTDPALAWKSRRLYMGDLPFGDLRGTNGYVVVHDIYKLSDGLRLYARDAAKIVNLDFFDPPRPTAVKKKRSRVPKLFTHDEVRAAYLAQWEPYRETAKEVCGPCPVCMGGTDRFHIGRGDTHDLLIGCRQCPDGQDISVFFNALGLYRRTGGPDYDEADGPDYYEPDGPGGEPRPAEPVMEVGEWDMTVRPLEWIVPLIALRGKVTRISGAPKAGKSVMLASLVARLTRAGAPLPGGGKSPGYRVIYLPLEEDPATDVNPRLVAAGVDPNNLRRVRCNIHGVVGAAFGEAVLQGIEAYTDWRPDVIAIDPLAHFMRRGNDADASRTTIGALNDLAKQCNAAVIVVDHSAKMGKARLQQTDDIGDLASGSVQQAATARQNWVIKGVKDEETGVVTPVMAHTGGNADFPDDQQPIEEYRLHSATAEVQPGATGRYIKDFDPASGYREGWIAEADGRSAPSEVADAIRKLLADKQWHQLSEVEGDFTPQTLGGRAKILCEAGELERMNAKAAKAEGLLTASDPTNNRALAYRLTPAGQFQLFGAAGVQGEANKD